jgi:hypothetical protein
MKTRQIAKTYSTAKPQGSGSLGRWLQRGASLVGCAALCAAAAGCGAAEDTTLLDTTNADPAQEASAADELGTAEQALRCSNGGVASNDPNCPWRTPWHQLLPDNNIDISHRMAPALCANPTGGWLTVSVDATSKYNVLQWHSLGLKSRSPSWSVYGSTRTWNSKPACANRENINRPQDGQEVGGFVIAGKLKSSDPNTNNKLFASPGFLSPASSMAENPTFQSGFAIVDPQVPPRSYSTGGLPGMSSAVDEAGAGSVVLAFMGDDLRTIHAHVHNLPYTNFASWGTRLNGPVLPTGWTAVGAPSVTRMPATFQIMVHAHNNATGGDRLYETHFFSGGSGGVAHFSNEIGSPFPTWTLRLNSGTIADDPWITYHPEIGTTAYFRRGTQIMQTGQPFGTRPVLAVRPDTGIVFASAPAATGGVSFDQGTHIVTARSTSNQIFWIESNNDAQLGQ